MSKTLLVLSGGHDAARAAQRAREMGSTTVVADSDPEAPAFAFADSCLIADARSPEETCAAAERYNRKLRRIDGVLALAPDTQAVATRVAERLRLPGPSPACVQRMSDRLEFQRALAGAGIATPWRRDVETPQALRRLAIEEGHDLLLRPIESHMEAGTQHVTKLEEMDRAFLLARQHSPGNRVIAEQRLDGPRGLVQAAVADGVCLIIAIADCVGHGTGSSEAERGESGFDLPGRYFEDARTKIGDILGRACAALDIRDGLIAGTIVRHRDEPYLLALSMGVAAEPFWTNAIQSSAGIDLIGMAVNFALGEGSIPAIPAQNTASAVAERHIAAKRGRVTRIWGEGEARAVPGVAELQIMVKQGDRILSSGEPRIAAAVLAKGVSCEDASAAAQKALSCLHIEMS